MEKKLREKPFSMRMTHQDRKLLRLLTEAMEEPSDTQTVLRLIRKEAKALGIALPNTGE